MKIFGLGDANIPGYNRALVAPTGFASDPYPFLNNTWQKLAYKKVRYSANVHPVMGTQIVPTKGLGRVIRKRRVYNPLNLDLPRRIGLGDGQVFVTTGQMPIPQSNPQTQPYGVDQSNNPVYIDAAGNVYDQAGDVLTDLSQITTLDALRSAGVLPSGVNVGPPNQIYASAGPGGITVSSPPPTPPPPQPSWFSKPSGVMGLSNGGLLAGSAGAAVLLSTLRSAGKRR